MLLLGCPYEAVTPNDVQDKIQISFAKLYNSQVLYMAEHYSQLFPASFFTVEVLETDFYWSRYQGT
jgi:hypothetical protein